jgi:hypothetical protein
MPVSPFFNILTGQGEESWRWCLRELCGFDFCFLIITRFKLSLSSKNVGFLIKKNLNFETLKSILEGKKL